MTRIVDYSSRDNINYVIIDGDRTIELLEEDGYLTVTVLHDNEPHDGTVLHL